jgi:sulfite reductase (ferredoxin)
MAEQLKETKTQRIERLKLEKNAWECLDEISAFAHQGRLSIPPEWLGTYFRFCGIYTQGDGVGAVGGMGGEGKALPYFMVRIRIPNGLLRAHQVRTTAEVTRKYARDITDITVRQNIRLHWVTIEDLPKVLDALWRAGLTTKGSRGDDLRNGV